MIVYHLDSRSGKCLQKSRNHKSILFYHLLKWHWERSKYIWKIHSGNEKIFKNMLSITKFEIMQDVYDSFWSINVI